MGVAYVDQIVPTGVQDGVNRTFTLPSAPNPPLSLKYYYNGILQEQGNDYTLTGGTVVLVYVAPLPTDIQVAWYRYQT